MFFIRAINYLIAYIEQHLASRLKVEPALVEITLAQRLKIQIDQTVHLSQLPLSNPPPPSSVQKPRSLQQKLQPKTEILRDFNSNFPETTRLDDTKLRLLGRSGLLTWGEFVTTSEEDFKTHLKNELKNEKTADKKMYILVRFMRQLQALSERAKQELTTKERAREQNAESVDQSLLDIVKATIGKSLRLAEMVLEDDEISVTVSSWLPTFTLKSKPCKTEAILATCEEVVTKFFEFCQSVNLRRKISIHEPGSMIDVLPSLIEKRNPLTLIDQHSSDYIIENLLTAAQYHAYQKYNLALPATYDENVGEAKRQTVETNLLTFYELAKNYKDNPEEYWDQTLTTVDVLKNALGEQTPYWAYCLGKQQRATSYCQEMHIILRDAAGCSAPRAAGNHKYCNK